MMPHGVTHICRWALIREWEMTCDSPFICWSIPNDTASLRGAETVVGMAVDRNDEFTTGDAVIKLNITIRSLWDQSISKSVFHMFSETKNVKQCLVKRSLHTCSSTMYQKPIKDNWGTKTVKWESKRVRIRVRNSVPLHLRGYAIWPTQKLK